MKLKETVVYCTRCVAVILGTEDQYAIAKAHEAARHPDERGQIIYERIS